MLGQYRTWAIYCFIWRLYWYLSVWCVILSFSASRFILLPSWNRWIVLRVFICITSSNRFLKTQWPNEFPFSFLFFHSIRVQCSIRMRFKVRITQSKTESTPNVILLNIGSLSTILNTPKYSIRNSKSQKKTNNKTQTKQNSPTNSSRVISNKKSEPSQWKVIGRELGRIAGETDNFGSGCSYSD